VVGGTALSIAPGEDVRYLLASLVVVIVGGLGSVTGAAIGALLIGLAEQFGLAYFPTYGVVLTFLIMVFVLAVRPQGIMGGRWTMDRRRFFSRDFSISDIHPATVIVVLFLVAYPTFTSDFFTYQIGAYSLILGTIALSLMMLAGYGGMVSLAQLTVAGVAGYLMAILGDNSVGVMGLGWPWWLTALTAILAAAVFSAFIGAIAVRTEGIYTIMITLAIAVAFFYFVRQNYVIFNGFTGFAGVLPPTLFGLYWRDPVPFYYLCLFIAGFYFLAVRYGARSTFGLSLQAIRDNPRRMRALGYDCLLYTSDAADDMQC